MKKILISIIAALCCCCVFIGCRKVVSSNETLPEIGNVYGTEPDEGIVIDGKADEQIWKEKNYFVNSSDSLDAKYYVTTNITEKGVYVYAFSEDSTVSYTSRNAFSYNTHFYFIIGASDKITKFNEGLCRKIKIDTSNYTMPTNFQFTGASQCVGEVNGGKTQGMSAEVFVTWEQLNSEPTDEIMLYSAYMKVRKSGNSGSYIANSFASDNPATYQRYNNDGYIDTSDTENKLGTSSFGTAKTGGIVLTDKGMEVVGGGTQTAYFSPYSDKFVAETSVVPKGAVYNSSKTAKAGVVLNIAGGYYLTVAFDLRTDNTAGGLFGSDRLFTVTNYPNKDQVRTNTVYVGADGAYDELTLRVIKNGDKLMYCVNDKLVYYDELPWMKSEVTVGVYSDNASCIFTDYMCKDCAKDLTTLNKAIKQVGYEVTADNSSPDVLFENYDFVVPKNGTATLDMYVASGLEIDKVYNNKAEDLTNRIKDDINGATLKFDNTDRNLNLSATVKELTEYVTLSGVITDKDGKTLSYADIRVVSDSAFACYYANADNTGKYEIKVKPNTEYTVSVSVYGYRTTKSLISAADKDEKQDIKVDGYFVGGSTSSTDGSTVYNSNIAVWDLTNESDSEVILDLQDRLSGGSLYFSDIYEENVIINVTISNITDRNIGVYETDPGAGIFVTQRRDGKTHSAVYNLYQAGYRVRPNGSYDGSLTYKKDAAKTNLATSSAPIKYTFVRLKNYFYMYIDGKVVYAAKNDNIQGAAAYAFCYDSSSTLKLKFSEYSIVYGNDALEQGREMLGSKFQYDKSKIQVDGLQDGYGLYKTTPVISVKNISPNKVVKVSVNDADFYLSAGNNRIETPIETYGKDSKVVVECGNEQDAYKVSGKVNMPASVAALFGSGAHAEATTDSDGSYELYLPSGNFLLYAFKDGYITDSCNVSVSDSAVGAEELILKKDPLVKSTKINGKTFYSRTVGYIPGFNEKENRYSVAANKEGNGGAIYFDNLWSENVIIKFSFVKNGGSESDMGIGVWTATDSSPDSHNSVQIVFKKNRATMRDCVTGGTTTWKSTPSGWDINGGNGYDVNQTGVIFDAAFVRKGDEYYVYLKTSSEDAYGFVGKFVSDTVRGSAAYGFTITAGNAISEEIFGYSYSTETADIDAFIAENGNE